MAQLGGRRDREQDPWIRCRSRASLSPQSSVWLPFLPRTYRSSAQLELNAPRSQTQLEPWHLRANTPPLLVQSCQPALRERCPHLPGRIPLYFLFLPVFTGKAYTFLESQVQSLKLMDPFSITVGALGITEFAASSIVQLRNTINSIAEAKDVVQDIASKLGGHRASAGRA